jgi:hypothetical protein
MDREKIEQVIEYLLSLEKPSGGFAFAKTVPSGIEDSYFAIRSLDSLGFQKDYTATRVWLSQKAWEPDLTGRVFYYRIQLYRRLELDVPWPLVKSQILEALPRIRGNPRKLDFFGRIAQLAERKGYVWEELEQTLSRETMNINLTVESRDTLESLGRKLRVSLIYGKTADILSILKFTEECRNPDGGYGCRPHTTSFLEHIYYALAIHLMLQKGIPSRERTLEFIRCCQSKKGGFGRSPGGVPFIDTTFYAVRSLIFAGGIAAEDRGVHCEPLLVSNR